ncbi:hypothetical protein GEPA3_2089 [Geobacillus sp. PA-3]|nr:hypothetical protein GEPA3_2089 [Geobacillus sp. PA-3]
MGFRHSSETHFVNSLKSAGYRPIFLRLLKNDFVEGQNRFFL